SRGILGGRTAAVDSAGVRGHFSFQAEDGIRDRNVTGVQTCALPISGRTKYLFQEVVHGIAGYGNCVGVPTVGGEVQFDDSYEENPLVNAMCVGLVNHEDIQKGIAAGVGNTVIYAGAPTGRDGIHGATFASDDLSKESDGDRPSVQVGDPFMEKLLIEACLEVIHSDALVGMQDMGAAGLTSSAS